MPRDVEAVSVPYHWHWAMERVLCAPYLVCASVRFVVIPVRQDSLTGPNTCIYPCLVSSQPSSHVTLSGGNRARQPDSDETVFANRFETISPCTYHGAAMIAIPRRVDACARIGYRLEADSQDHDRGGHWQEKKKKNLLGARRISCNAHIASLSHSGKP